MGKIISETSASLKQELDKQVGSVVGEHIDEEVDDILAALSEKSHIYLGEEKTDD